MSILEKAQFTVENFDALPDRERFELIAGDLVEREDMGLEAVYAAGKIHSRLDRHCEVHPIAWALSDGAEYVWRSADGNKHVCRPDASAVLKDRCTLEALRRPRFEGAPDFAVEVLSPTDLFERVEAKIMAYLEGGTKLVWLARPKTRRIVAYRPDGTEISHGPDDDVDAGPVLPGLRFRVAEVFLPPA